MTTDEMHAKIDGFKARPHAANWWKKHADAIRALTVEEHAELLRRYDAKVDALDAAWRAAHPEAAAAGDGS